MEKTINRENISQHLMEHQLSLANSSIMDALNKENYRFELTLTRTQHEEFKKYAIKLIQKIFKINKLKATNTFTFFDQSFGLRIRGI